jgi:hypothetical protein
LPARAQNTDNMVHFKDGSGVDRDGATYRITKAVLPRFAAALHELAALRKSDPALFAARPDALPPAVRAIYARAKITPEEWGRFFSAVLTARLIGEESDNSAEFPVLHENIRFLRANAAAMKQIDVDIATFVPDMEIKR